MKQYFALVSFIAFAVLFIGTANGAVNEPIWISPSEVNSFSNSEQYPIEKGVWTTIDTGAGARGNGPGVVMDSKGTLWIMFGSLAAYDHNLYTVWNYNPKTDQYRWVWRSNETDPALIRNPGELGIPAETNHPGSILYVMLTIDKNDNIWFPSNEYGGEFWMFNTSSWLFTRMQGLSGQTGEVSVGANPGQPGEDVWPGDTQGACLLTDSQNQIWLLAGWHAGSISNTVWMLNTTSLLWTFVGGSVATIYDPFPGAESPGCFMDENDRAWLYGGYAFDIATTSFGKWGSIWTFDTRVNRTWELEYGNHTFNTWANVTSADFHPDNQPPATDGAIFVDRLDGTIMLVVGAAYNDQGEYGATDMVWLYGKSLKQWKLVHGNSSATNTAGAFTHYRQSGSTMPSRAYFGQVNGQNTNGDVYIVGGSFEYYASYLEFNYTNYNDIWIIPRQRDYCANATCDTHATCIAQVLDYTCQCNDGFTGDGFTCTAAVPPSSNEPMGNASPSTSPVAATPKQKTSDAMIVTASLIGLLLGLLAI